MLYVSSVQAQDEVAPAAKGEVWLDETDLANLTWDLQKEVNIAKKKSGSFEAR